MTNLSVQGGTFYRLATKRPPNGNTFRNVFPLPPSFFILYFSLLSKWPAMHSTFFNRNLNPNVIIIASRCLYTRTCTVWFKFG